MWQLSGACNAAGGVETVMQDNMLSVHANPCLLPLYAGAFQAAGGGRYAGAAAGGGRQ